MNTLFNLIMQNLVITVLLIILIPIAFYIIPRLYYSAKYRSYWEAKKSNKTLNKEDKDETSKCSK